MNTSKNELERINEVASVLQGCMSVSHCKLTKSGRIKKTVNNQKETRKVDPIKNIDDIKRCKEYLYKKVLDTKRNDYKYAAMRNYTIMCVGINQGLRISDVLSLKWNDVFMEDFKTFREKYRTMEKKTHKGRTIYINNSFKKAIKDFIDMFPVSKDMYDSYVFINRQGNQLHDDTVNNIMKDLQLNVVPNLNLGTHSMRKTWAYQCYKKTNDLALVQEMLQHSSTRVTRMYLNIAEDDFKMAYNLVEL